MSEIPSKVCTKCKSEYSATPEYWYKAPHGKYGFQAICKDCHKKLNGVGLNPKNSVRDGQKACSCCKIVFPATLEFFPAGDDVKGGLRSQCKQCFRESNKATKSRNKAKISEWSKNYYQNHKDEYAARQQRYLREDPTRFRVATVKRRAKRRNLPNEFTPDDWRCCLEYWNGLCCYCGNPAGFWNPMSADHYIALSKGGGTVRLNMLPACKSCNSSKHDEDALTWLTRKLGKRKAKRIIETIQAYFRWLDSK